VEVHQVLILYFLPLQLMVVDMVAADRMVELFTPLLLEALVVVEHQLTQRVRLVTHRQEHHRKVIMAVLGLHQMVRVAVAPVRLVAMAIQVQTMAVLAALVLLHLLQVHQ
jgi:hypothetical protein